jgi:hypothetical protein
MSSWDDWRSDLDAIGSHGPGGTSLRERAEILKAKA